jgi:hypothetical protein
LGIEALGFSYACNTEIMLQNDELFLLLFLEGIGVCWHVCLQQKDVLGERVEGALPLGMSMGKGSTKDLTTWHDTLRVDGK